MVGQSLQTMWKMEGNLPHRYSYMQAFSVHRASRSTARSQSRWLIWCILQRRPHLSFGSSKSFLCLKHWHCPAFTEIQAILILLKHQALGDNFMKSMPPCQFTWWLHTGLKSDHIWSCGTLQRKATSAERQYHSSWCFPFQWQFEYVTLKPCSLHIRDISSTVNSIKSWRQAPEDVNSFPLLTESRRCSMSSWLPLYLDWAWFDEFVIDLQQFVVAFIQQC